MHLIRTQLRRPVSWLLAAAILVATTGVSVHQIYCYCLGETSISLFGSDDPCSDTHPVAESCCAVKPPSCCAKAASKSDICHSHKDGCTKKSTRFFQVKEKFTVELFKLKPVAQALLVVLPEWRQPGFLPADSPALCFNKAPPPPPLCGRDISIRQQTFRC